MTVTAREERLQPHDYVESDEPGLCRRCGFPEDTHDEDLALARQEDIAEGIYT